MTRLEEIKKEFNENYQAALQVRDYLIKHLPEGGDNLISGFGVCLGSVCYYSKGGEQVNVKTLCRLPADFCVQVKTDHYGSREYQLKDEGDCTAEELLEEVCTFIDDIGNSLPEIAKAEEWDDPIRYEIFTKKTKKD